MKFSCTRGAAYEYRDLDTEKRYFSVSQILEVLDPGAFDRVDPDVMENAQIRGKRLHHYFTLTIAARAGLCAAPEPIQGLDGYCQAIRNLVSVRKLRPMRLEESSVNRKLGIAGTPDALCWDEFDKPILTIGDLKTGTKRRVHSVQLHCYRKLDGYESAKALATYYVSRDGSFQVMPYSKSLFDEAAILNAINLLKWRHGR